MLEVIGEGIFAEFLRSFTVFYEKGKYIKGFFLGITRTVLFPQFTDPEELISCHMGICHL